MGKIITKALFLGFVLLAGASVWAADGGFLFVTFKGEQTPMSEQIYFAVSPDGCHWHALNGSQPVLTSKLGEKGVRDPYLVRSPDGKAFHIVATDLSINLNHDWNPPTHAGSKSIVVWDSADLVHWSPPRQGRAGGRRLHMGPRSRLRRGQKRISRLLGFHDRQRQFQQAPHLGRVDQGSCRVRKTVRLRRQAVARH